MAERRPACPRCGRAVDADWSYCPQCAMVLDAGEFDREALSDRIRYIRRESAERSRRNVYVHSLANLAVVVAVLLMLGGGVLLFHPALIPALFSPATDFSLPEMPALPSGATSTDSTEALTRFDWVDIPAGEFLQGPYQGRPGEELSREYVPHFQILRYEVTNGHWCFYLQDERERLLADGRYDGSVPRNWGWKRDSGAAPAPPPGTWDKPVTSITIYEAQDFCTHWLANQPGCQGARLPSQYEWEKAARGTEDDRPWPWGTEFYDVDPQTRRKVLRCNVRDTGLGESAPVRSFSLTDVSPFGIVGMAGNVAEYVLSGQYNQPGVKGGAFSLDAYDARIDVDMALQAGSDFDFTWVGFRAARDVPETGRTDDHDGPPPPPSGR